MKHFLTLLIVLLSSFKLGNINIAFAENKWSDENTVFYKQQEELSRGPNIVFIYTDDQAVWGVGAYGNNSVHTPNIDRLAKEGALFENAFVTTPVCSPARASLLTGMHSFRTGITDFINIFREPKLGLKSEFITWPRILQQNGYKTGLFGKWHLGLEDNSHPRKFGYDTFYGFLEGGTTTMNPILEVKGVKQEVFGSTPDILTNAAIDFIEKNQDFPVLVSLHFRAPHVPYGPVPEEDDTVYRNMDINLPDYSGLDPEWTENTIRDHFKSIASIDRNIGRILKALDELELTKNTLVIFTSDHGYMIGHNGVYGKGTATIAGEDIRGNVRRPNMFDHAIRTPLIIRQPDYIKPGTRISEMVTHLDFFPTLLNISGLSSKIPDEYPIHGRDFSPILSGQEIAWRTAIFGDYDMYHYVENSMRMIRTEEWKLIIHSHPEYGPELYNVKEDPDEKVNLVGKRYFEVMTELRNQLLGWQLWVGDPMYKN